MNMKKSDQRKITKAIKNTNKSIILCFIIFLVLGLGAGFATSKILTLNDTFEIIGEQTITLNVGETYNDEGARAIEFHKDISDQIVIEGLEQIDTSVEGEYIIIYTLNSKRYKNIQRVRYVIVTSESGDSND